MLTEEQIRQHIFTDEDGVEWVPAQVARLIVPSRVPGKKVVVSTLKKMWQQGKLDRAKHPHHGQTSYFRLDQLRALAMVKREGPPGSVQPAPPSRPVADTASVLERMTRAIAPTLHDGARP